MKSTWPGVSIRLMVYCSPLRTQGQVVAAELIVMPRFCSSSSKSMTAVPSWTSPILWILPV